MNTATAALSILIHGTGWILVLLACQPRRIPLAVVGMLLASADIAF